MNFSRTSTFFALALALGGCGSMPPAMASVPTAPQQSMPAPSPAPQAPGAAVAGDAPSPAMPTKPASAPSPGAAPSAPATTSAHASATPSAKTTADKAETAQALVVYVGDLGMTADEAAIAPTLDRVVDVAEALGGHLAGRTDSSVKVKIPSKRFREGMSAVEKLGEVTRRSVTADDVTAQFADLEVRLENLRATRKRLEEFLARAGNIQDTLTVEQQLERVAKEIDVIQGQLRFLRDATSFSVLSVALTPKPKPKPAEVVAVKEPPPPVLPPPPRVVSLPIEWLGDVGLRTLLDVSKSN